MKRRLNKNLITTLTLVALLLCGNIAFAQSILDTTSEAIIVTTNPQNPAPESNVKLTVTSSLVDLSNSQITWFVNGKTVLKGKDERSLTTKIGKIGETTSISVVVDSPDYGLVTKSFTFSPGGVDLLYEAETFTPPLYKGKSLATPQSIIKAIAITTFKTKNGSPIMPKDLVFTWKKDGEIDGANSGRGKSTYRFDAGALPTNTPLIEVFVRSPEYGYSGYSSLLVPHENPEILLYEDNAILGVMLENTFADTYSMFRPEISLVAYPFFFSAKTKDSKNLKFDWSINSTTVTPKGDSPAKITLRRPEGRGNSYLTLEVNQTGQIFQTASANINMSYGN